MSTARSSADIMCLAVYTLADGKVLRGFLLQTVADRLGINWDRAMRMAEAADEAGLIRHEHGTVVLTGEGQTRGATLTAPKSSRKAPLLHRVDDKRRPTPRRES